MYKKHENIDMSYEFRFIMSKKLEIFDMKARYVDGIDISYKTNKDMSKL